MRIQRLQTRIIVFFVALLALVQVAAFWFVNAANSGNARAKVEEELNVGQRVFARLLEQNADKLKLSARVLAADFAFREAIATHDNRTISSVLANHGARIGARRVGGFGAGEVVSAWMGSPTHHDLILSGTYRDAGVGCWFRQPGPTIYCVITMGG